jgi:calcineurin-like phosphoesterase family protein
MAWYVISDLHLGHANIIDHCDRPFENVEEMNEILIDNWNTVIGDSQDIVVFLGDLGHFADEEQLRMWLEKLNGRIIFIEGNHDSPVRYVDGVNTHQYYELTHGDWNFCCAHRPENAPRRWDGWVLHGHHHGDEAYPLINPINKQCNLSVEVINYRPLNLKDLIDYIECDEKLYRLD